MVNTGMLRKAIKEKGHTIESISRAIGMDDSTFYRKVNGGGGKFTLAEADAITAALGLESGEAQRIFFDSQLAEMRVI